MASLQAPISARTLIAVDSELIYDLKAILKDVSSELSKSIERERIANDLAESRRLLNEAEAMNYLRRDADTLLYYRKNGLPYYKCGRDVWYTKGDIDNWLASGYVSRRVNN